MLQKTKKRRLKKPVKIGILVFLIILVGGTLAFLPENIKTDITGYFTLDNEPPEENPNIVSFMINFTERPTQIDNQRWSLYQRYRLDDARTHQYCEIDCANLCSEKGLGYQKGYVQMWGKCNCKCELP